VSNRDILVLRSITSSIELGNILSTPFRLILQFFILSPHDPLCHLPSPSSPLLNHSLSVVACVRVCIHTQLWAFIAGVTHFRSLFEFTPHPSPPVCLCWDSGWPLIFKYPLNRIQKPAFPPVRAGSRWHGFGVARCANEASFSVHFLPVRRDYWLLGSC